MWNVEVLFCDILKPFPYPLLTHSLSYPKPKTSLSTMAISSAAASTSKLSYPQHIHHSSPSPSSNCLFLSFPQQLLSLPILKRVIIHTQHHPKLNWFRARAAHISCGPEPPNPISDLSDPGPNPDPESQQHAELPGAEAHPYEARGHASEAHEAIQRGSTEALGEVGG